MKAMLVYLLLLGLTACGATVSARTDIDIPEGARFLREAGVSGSVTLYDPATHTWYYTDRGQADTPSLPASTFKIINSLILLQEAVVGDPREQIRWDGVERTLGGKPYPAWNRDHTLASAFKDSAVWVYAVLSERAGRDVYRQWLSRLNYGNGALDGADPLFWLRGDFGVTPRQQIVMLCELYRETLPFDAKHQQAVKAMMASVPPEHMRGVFGKTGLVTQEGKDIGWWCGWLELPDPVAPQGDPYLLFFATRLSREAGAFDPHFAALRQQVTYRVAEVVLALKAQNQ